MSQATGGVAISSIDYSNQGSVNGVSLTFFKSLLSGAGSIPPLTTISAHYYGSETGLTIEASNPVSLPTGKSWYSADINFLQFTNDKVTSVTGSVTILRIIPVPGGSKDIQDRLNSNKDALDVLNRLAGFLNDCDHPTKK